MALAVEEYARAIDALFARTAGHVKPGLSRTEAMLLALGDPHRQVPVFHVAGTNGKGSVCATIDALLRHRGLRVGRYTSPHLVDFRERIVVDGIPIPPEEVLAFLHQIERAADVLEATFFEITTVMAFWYFAIQRVDVAVIETGLGGTYDSTNVVDPVVATVTNIGLDHTEYLGTTLEQIADEKAGIFKFGRPALIGERRTDLSRRLAQSAVSRGATPVTVLRDQWRRWGVELANGHTAFTASTPDGELRLSTPLYGEHQAQNALTALAATWLSGERYRVPPAELNHALARVSLPGRAQRVGEWLFDVAHNPAGARVLADTILTLSLPRPLTAVVGVLGDKDWRGILDALAPVVDSFIITQPASAPAPRVWDPMEASLYATTLGVPVLLEVKFDLAVLRAQERQGTRVVTGSFHTVGDAMRALGIDPLAAS